MPKEIINPNSITRDDLPLIVLSGHSWNIISFLIRLRTKATYNHIMMMRYPREFVSQDYVYRQVPMDKYLKRGNRLKFWKIKDLTFEEKAILHKKVNDDLAAHWWYRKYDVIGVVFGQLLGIKKINNPLTNYCSERVADTLRTIIPEIPHHPSPTELNNFFKKHSRFEVYGYWFVE